MSEALRGMGIAAGILLPVVVLIVIVSMAAVRRGEAMMRGDIHGHSPDLVPAYVPAAAGTAAATAKTAKVVTTDEISVLEILGFGTLLFVITVLLLLGLSILRHL